MRVYDNEGNHSEKTWKIVPTRTPRVFRRCNRCDIRRAFVSSHKFRVNSQQKRMDAWLVYKCEVCEQTWNCAIFNRLTRREIGEDLYRRLIDNDERTAQQCAFDYELLKRNQVEVEEQVDYRVEGDVLDWGRARGAVRICITFNLAARVRLDKLLARQLGLSRKALKVLCAQGDISWEGKHKLSKPIAQNLWVTVVAEAIKEP